MPRSRQSSRRHIHQIRASFANQPLAFDSRVLGELQTAIELGDISAVKSALQFGGEDVPSSIQIIDGVAVIPVVGALRDSLDFMVRYYGAACYQVIEKEFKTVLNRSDVKAVVFWMATPGGQAVGCKRLADLIHSSRGVKPIVAYVQSMAASAGYYLAAACDKICAQSDAIVGSIGTIMTHQEVSKLAADIGYKFTVLTNEDSPKKGHGNPYEPLTKESKATLQGFVDSYGQTFIADVASFRNISTEKVVKDYGQGDAFIATEAMRRGMVDEIVAEFGDVIEALTNEASNSQPIETTDTETETDTSGDPPTESRSFSFFKKDASVKKITAQLFATGLISAIDASEDAIKSVLNAWFNARGESVPTDESSILKALQGGPRLAVSAVATSPQVPSPPPAAATAAAANSLQDAHNREQAEARSAAAAEQRATLADLQASAKLMNDASGADVVTPAMVLEAFQAGLDARGAVKSWNDKIAANEKPIQSTRVTVKAEGSDLFAADAVEALLYRATSQPIRRRGGRDGANNATQVATPNLSTSAAAMAGMPIWAIAARALEQSGVRVDIYGDRESICSQAMEMGNSLARHTFFSAHEGRQFIGASGAPGGPYARPGDFPNILSALANKFLDSIELDEWTYPEFTAVWPTGFGDFKPATMVNTGTPDELDEIVDSGTFNELKKAEEVLSYIFCRRFGNKWGWTPVLMANDDMGAFAEGMLGLDEAWETTQHRLCLALLTGNPTLLDTFSLFGTTRTAGTNDRTSGGAPSDSEWAAMETLYADIKGVSTARRVRGSLNTILVPTGTQYQEARRTFMPLAAGGIEPKMAATTANTGIYRGQIAIVPEPELRDDSVATRYYAMRSPTALRTATIVRGYFNGYGAGGKRERWYDPTNKTTWVSIEGRIGVAIKNWRYVVRNKGAA